MAASSFEFCLFCVDPDIVKKASLGIDAIVIDWEVKGKDQRQKGFATQINHQSVNDLIKLRKITFKPLICRINPFSDNTPHEMRMAIDNGANELLVPMVKNRNEVKAILDEANGKIEVGIMIETNEAVQNIKDFSSLPLKRAFVGLNDLSIANKETNLFLPLIDGRMESISKILSFPFGFGGLTLPSLGFPLPCHLLLNEMIRLKSSFTFLRRSFLKDIQGKDILDGLFSMREALKMASKKTEKEIDQDHLELVKTIQFLKKTNQKLL